MRSSAEGSCGDSRGRRELRNAAAAASPFIAVILASGILLCAQDVEQTTQGSRDSLQVLESFDGLGNGFTGPQGTATLRNPSDNSLAVGPDHIVQIVNSRMAIFTKKGRQFETTGHVLYGP